MHERVKHRRHGNCARQGGVLDPRRSRAAKEREADEQTHHLAEEVERAPPSLGGARAAALHVDALEDRLDGRVVAVAALNDGR